ncbi:MAG: hypothetical protein KKI15_02720 [Proteobacteria bacterium]|nr:hypothetical protein [Pseudomonadota bacterium]
MSKILRQQYDSLKKKAQAGEHLSVKELNSLAKLEADLEDLDADELFDTPEQVAEYGGYKPRTVYADVKKGVLIRQDDGTFLQDDVDTWLAAKGRMPAMKDQDKDEQEDGEKTKWDKAEEEAKYRHYRAIREKLLVEKLKGEQLPKKEVIRQNVNRAHEYKTSLLLFSRAVSHKIAAASGIEAKVISAIIDTEAKNILTAMSRRLDLHVD